MTHEKGIHIHTTIAFCECVLSSSDLAILYCFPSVSIRF